MIHLTISGKIKENNKLPDALEDFADFIEQYRTRKKSKIKITRVAIAKL